MPFDPLRHHRRSIRLKGYDYSREGGYYVTICTQYHECTLGNVVNGEMVFSESGRIANEGWLAIPNDLPYVTLDEYQIMPNHVHGIVVIWEDDVRDMIGKDRSVTDLIGEDRTVRDLINQIPPGDQIPPGNPNPPGHQIPSGARIPLGLSNAKFSNMVDWPLMKNPKQTLGKVIRHFKAKATKEIHDAGFHEFRWQGRFHDHIIRNKDELDRIRKYIQNNPLKWELDSHSGGDL